MLYEKAPQDKGLAAYVTVLDSRTSVSDLRSKALEYLPSNMVPRWFVILKEFPIGATGKIDKKRLPEPSIVHENAQTATAARNELEAGLLEIWTEVLQVDVTSIDQNIFELGGDSIGAIKIAARVTATGASVDPRDIFAAESVRRLAELIVFRQAESKKTNSAELEITQRKLATVSAEDMSALISELDL